jgi:hypothetical protein
LKEKVIQLNKLPSFWAMFFQLHKWEWNYLCGQRALVNLRTKIDLEYDSYGWTPIDDEGFEDIKRKANQVVLS